jgi:hypothetical protein
VKDLVSAITRAGPKFDFEPEEVLALYNKLADMQMSFIESQADVVAKVCVCVYPGVTTGCARGLVVPQRGAQATAGYLSFGPIESLQFSCCCDHSVREKDWRAAAPGL